MDEPETVFTDLTLGNVYRVIGIEADSYRVINDEVIFPRFRGHPE